MDAATIQLRIYKGRAKAALRIGLPCNVYRPVDATQALATQIATTNVAFNAADSIYKKPAVYDRPVWFGDYDGTLTQPGDYLVRQLDGKIWFVADQPQLLPIVLTHCNCSLVVERQPVSTAVGAVPYGGLTDLTPVLGATMAWPASMLIGGRALTGEGLPTDVKQGGWRILLPPSVPVQIEAGDILIVTITVRARLLSEGGIVLDTEAGQPLNDETSSNSLNRRCAVESAELSDLGWRLIANEMHD